MSKRNRKKNYNQQSESDEAAVNPVSPEQAEAESGPVEPVNEEPVTEEAEAASLPNPTDVPPAEEEPAPGPVSASTDADSESLDEILADVRHSLIEDDAEKSGREKKPSWWNRIVGGKGGEPAANAASQEESLAAADVQVSIPAAEPKAEEPEEYVEEIDELIKMLETEDAAPQAEAPVHPQEIPAPEPEPEVHVDLEDLKKQAFAPRAEAVAPESYTEVREVALSGDGEEDVFVEVEAKPADPWDERVKSVENALRPYRRYLNYTFAFLGVVMAVVAGMVAFRAYQDSRPVPVPTEGLNLPYPVSVTLPGGLGFNLGKGALKDGEWNPKGPEWLAGTEVCRWVAIPWSRPLEAAIRTMTQEDKIDLLMSNNDKLAYSVYSIREMTLEEIQQTDANTPCLLLILSKQDSDKRWVVTALP